MGAVGRQPLIGFDETDTEIRAGNAWLKHRGDVAFCENLGGGGGGAGEGGATSQN